MGQNVENVDELNTSYEQNYLKDAKLDSSIKATVDLNKAVQFSDIYLMALPTKAIREVSKDIDQLLTSKRLLFMLLKALKTIHLSVSEMIEDSISSEHNGGIGVLSGPSHAEEVVIKQPTTVAASSKDNNVSKLIQDLFMNDYLRVYTNNDLVGVELGGALKIL